MAVEKAIRGGADVVQLRDKNLSDEEFLAMAKDLLKITRRYDVPLILNDRPYAVKASGADGLHMGQEDGSLAWARSIVGEGKIVGCSTHNHEQAEAAEKEGFDYIGVGPVFSTPTKPHYEPVGLELVRFAANNIHVPFVAIGGIDIKNVEDVLKAGARTVAVVRAIMASDDPEAAAKAFAGKMGARSIG